MGSMRDDRSSCMTPTPQTASSGTTSLGTLLRPRLGDGDAEADAIIGVATLFFDFKPFAFLCFAARASFSLRPLSLALYPAARVGLSRCENKRVAVRDSGVSLCGGTYFA